MFLQHAVVTVALLMAGVPPCVARAAETLPGPYLAAVEHIIDGDTVAARVTIWLNQEVKTLVRIRGIDAPEKRSRCAAERSLAERARTRLFMLTGGHTVILANVEGGKYWGRVIADVVTADGRDAAAEMVRAGLARPYDGGKRLPWCDKRAEPIN